MLEISDETLRLIKRASKGKKHLKLTVGYLTDNNSVIKTYNENGELDSSKKYHYEIGSITKTFTVSLLSKYVFEKKLSINDSIQKYIGEIKGDDYYPTLLRLATHSSGYSARLPLNKREYSNLILGLIIGGGDLNKHNPLNMDFNKMKMLIENNKLKEMDYSWKYSNFGISLIGYGLGIVSGKGYWDTMNDFLHNELGLSDTYLGTSNNNLHGYDRKNNDCGNWKWNKENLISPAGAISSTADDLLKYAKINIYEDQPYLCLCHKKHGNGTKKYDMGLGWFLLKKNNNVILHGGGTGCFSSFLGIDKEKKVASVVLANYQLGRNDDENIGISLLESLQKSVIS
ncbi:serine hydrolase domain-containing protein [Bacillus pseudomycoides]|uniref:serine hydrolase domain-containing protein n=1 Tax=Bacillus pseudomycoides TaxID=64104 RepID=UPI000BED9875|nr:serine hydrolase domain-containing protein [Bacillus pseudomycoides]PEE04073.1 serine hydrolase [Bacillus pseudomycoides]PEM78942.1 serine hydrolase [Bacillus pseudomycoides]PHA78853.1 serine hydrolase [Bacillus pseudomycoides]PHC68094.1 serine hydrolase [Bacillus pseudomycoides]PHC79833.1 serine hydrolase [Bacillus pseudomycoides]